MYTLSLLDLYFHFLIPSFFSLCLLQDQGRSYCSTLSCNDGFCNNAVYRGMKAIIMEADRNIRIICNSFASRGSSPSPEKNLIPYKNFNCIAQKSYYFTHFLIILCFFAMNTKYVRKNIEKPLRHILDVYIYHIYEVSSYCPPPLIKTPWRSFLWWRYGRRNMDYQVACSQFWRLRFLNDDVYAW